MSVNENIKKSTGEWIYNSFNDKEIKEFKKNWSNSSREYESTDEMIFITNKWNP
ncbi:MAG: hypothetical protein ACFE9L_10250 [Candidatus Hodarchaeota archaeon]